MKKVILLAAFGALFASCKKEEERCETWTYNEIVKGIGNPKCASFRENAYGLKKNFCGSELNGAAKDAMVKVQSNDCYELYTEFVEKD